MHPEQAALEGALPFHDIDYGDDNDFPLPISSDRRILQAEALKAA